MIYMKKLCMSDWLKMSAFFMQHDSNVVTRVKITNSTAKILSVLTFCDVFQSHVKVVFKNLLVLINTTLHLKSFCYICKQEAIPATWKTSILSTLPKSRKDRMCNAT